ncbi:MAG: hypothetical protein WCS94_00660 [Verrucomicrobiota bacterium]
MDFMADMMQKTRLPREQIIQIPPAKNAQPKLAPELKETEAIIEGRFMY